MNLETGLLWIWLLCIVACIILLNVRGMVAMVRAVARWIGNRIADVLFGRVPGGRR